jgi:hypothetical protein
LANVIFERGNSEHLRKHDELADRILRKVFPNICASICELKRAGGQKPELILVSSSWLILKPFEPRQTADHGKIASVFEDRSAADIGWRLHD